MIIRRQTREIRIGNVIVGGMHPISVQSMTNTDTRDVEATVRQIHDLEKGCDNFWHGKADKDGTAVNVVLSPQGSVMVEGN